MPRDTVVGIIVMVGVVNLIHIFCSFVFAFVFDSKLVGLRNTLLGMGLMVQQIHIATNTPTRRGAKFNVDELRKYFKSQKNEEALMLVEALDKHFQRKKRIPKAN